MAYEHTQAFRHKVQRLAMVEVNNSTELDQFLSPQSDFSSLDGSDLNHKVLCPIPSQADDVEDDSSIYKSIVDFAVPLIDLLELEFAMVTETSLLSSNFTVTPRQPCVFLDSTGT